MTKKNEFSRRSLMKATATMAAASTIDIRPARAADNLVPERKFLFFFAGGGWSHNEVFDPVQVKGGNAGPPDPNEYLGQVGNIQYNANDIDAPDVTRYLQRWGARTALVHGVDNHSVGHASGQQFAMTGTSASGYSGMNDTLAGMAYNDYPLPSMVFGGPTFPGRYSAAQIQAGAGTLIDLIDGSIVGQSDDPAPRLMSPSERVTDDFVERRVAAFAESKAHGLAKARAEALLGNMDRAREVFGRSFEAGLDDLGSTMLDQSIRAVELFRLNLSRTAMISIPGGWDSHGGDQNAGPQFNNWFMALDELMEHMYNTPGSSSDRLIDEVTIVGLSDFGRTPQLNGANGRDHWTFTGVFLAGSGINGDQNAGSVDEDGVGLPIDFSTGLQSNSGDYLGCESILMSLAKLANLSPDEVLPGVPALDAILKNP